MASNKLFPVLRRCFSSSTKRLGLADSFYNEEQKAIQATVKALSEEHINPFAEEWDKAQIFPGHKVFKEFGKAGMLGINKPVEYGGMGLDYKYEVAFMEGLGHCMSPGVCMALMVQTDCSTPALARFGSPELCAKYLAPAISGDAVTCVGVSEPGGGSDVASLKTTAKKDGGDWVINGTKMWITSSLQADWMCLLCNTSDGKPHMNKSLIIVPMDSPGITKEPIRKMGMHASDTGIITFENVRVPLENVIGDEGAGFMYQMLQFQEERLAGAAGTLVMLDQCVDKTIEYARERQVFGMSLLDNQVVHFRLAELKTEIELLRAGTYQAVEAMEAGENVTMMASMLKLKSGRLTREVTDSCLQFWGGMGFTEDVFISKAYRDGRLTSIGGGADEIMLGIICKMMGILPKLKK